MLLLRGILLIICTLFCGLARADDIDKEELTVEGTNEAETENRHPREKDEYSDQFLQEPSPEEPPLMIEGTNEEGDDICFDDQDVDDEDE